MEKQNRQYRDDMELVEAVRSGDKFAFREIVEKYEKTVARTVIGMLGNTADADDVGQEVFIRFFRSIDKYRGESSLGTYLTRIGINLSLNEIKRRKSKPWTSLEDKPDLDKSGDDRQGEFENKEIVQMALNKLEPEFKSVVVLRLLQGYSTKETSQILKIPLGTVLSRLARAQEKMRRVVEGMKGE